MKWWATSHSNLPKWSEPLASIRSSTMIERARPRLAHVRVSHCFTGRRGRSASTIGQSFGTAPMCRAGRHSRCAGNELGEAASARRLPTP
jgi:hypothetical protein